MTFGDWWGAEVEGKGIIKNHFKIILETLVNKNPKRFPLQRKPHSLDFQLVCINERAAPLNI